MTPSGGAENAQIRQEQRDPSRCLQGETWHSLRGQQSVCQGEQGAAGTSDMAGNPDLGTNDAAMSSSRLIISRAASLKPGMAAEWQRHSRGWTSAVVAAEASEPGICKERQEGRLLWAVERQPLLVLPFHSPFPSPVRTNRGVSSVGLPGDSGRMSLAREQSGGRERLRKRLLAQMEQRNWSPHPITTLSGVTGSPPQVTL